MFVVFEGIDGSGKTTISNLVAQKLRQGGVSVRHVREGGQFASPVTQSIRDLCRDSRNLAITPRTELLLYLAREVQLLEEVVVPGLDEADLVIADRFFYTAEVLACHGRGLPESTVRAIVDATRAGAGRSAGSGADGATLEPDLVILVDVDPSVARGRRKISKITAPDRRAPSRKGMAGAGMQTRLRDGYRALAARDRQRWFVVDNSDQDLTMVVDRVSALITVAREQGAREALAVARGRSGSGEIAVAGPAISSPDEALPAFLAWVDRRARREPPMAAYVLAGLAGAEIDPRRLALAPAAPRVMARGLRGLADPVSWELRGTLGAAAAQEVALSLVDAASAAPEAWAQRRELAEVAPAEVAASLQTLDHEVAWMMRERLWPLAPDGVMLSLAQVRGARAAELRDRWLAQRGGLEGRALRSYEGARTACRGVTGLEDERAWQIRQAAFEVAPAAAIESLEGLASERAWAWRQRSLERAPKAVLSTLTGLDDPRAWQMRQAMAPRCREALDTMLGRDHPLAWELRESCLDVWPAAAVKSLGGLVDDPRGQALLSRALERHADSLSLLKQAAAVAVARHQARPQVLAA